MTFNRNNLFYYDKSSMILFLSLSRNLWIILEITFFIFSSINFRLYSTAIFCVTNEDIFPNLKLWPKKFLISLFKNAIIKRWKWVLTFLFKLSLLNLSCLELNSGISLDFLFFLPLFLLFSFSLFILSSLSIFVWLFSIDW